MSGETALFWMTLSLPCIYTSMLLYVWVAVSVGLVGLTGVGIFIFHFFIF